MLSVQQAPALNNASRLRCSPCNAQLTCCCLRPCTPLLLLLVARGCPAAVLPHSACCTGGACVALAVRLCQQLVQQQLLRQLQRLRRHMHTHVHSAAGGHTHATLRSFALAQHLFRHVWLICELRKHQHQEAKHALRLPSSDRHKTATTLQENTTFAQTPFPCMPHHHPSHAPAAP